MIATFALCSNKAFSDILEGVVLKKFSGEKHPEPLSLLLLFHSNSLVLQM